MYSNPYDMLPTDKNQFRSSQFETKHTATNTDTNTADVNQNELKIIMDIVNRGNEILKQEYGVTPSEFITDVKSNSGEQCDIMRGGGDELVDEDSKRGFDKFDLIAWLIFTAGSAALVLYLLSKYLNPCEVVPPKFDVPTVSTAWSSIKNGVLDTANVFYEGAKTPFSVVTNLFFDPEEARRAAEAEMARNANTAINKLYMIYGGIATTATTATGYATNSVKWLARSMRLRLGEKYIVDGTIENNILKITSSDEYLYRFNNSILKNQQLTLEGNNIVKGTEIIRHLIGDKYVLNKPQNSGRYNNLIIKRTQTLREIIDKIQRNKRSLEEISNEDNMLEELNRTLFPNASTDAEFYTIEDIKEEEKIKSKILHTTLMQPKKDYLYKLLRKLNQSISQEEPNLNSESKRERSQNTKTKGTQSPKKRFKQGEDNDEIQYDEIQYEENSNEYDKRERGITEKKDEKKDNNKKRRQDGGGDNYLNLIDKITVLNPKNEVKVGKDIAKIVEELDIPIEDFVSVYKTIHFNKLESNIKQFGGGCNMCKHCGIPCKQQGGGIKNDIFDRMFGLKTHVCRIIGKIYYGTTSGMSWLIRKVANKVVINLCGMISIVFMASMINGSVAAVTHIVTSYILPMLPLISYNIGDWIKGDNILQFGLKATGGILTSIFLGSKSGIIGNAGADIMKKETIIQVTRLPGVATNLKIIGDLANVSQKDISELSDGNTTFLAQSQLLRLIWHRLMISKFLVFYKLSQMNIVRSIPDAFKSIYYNRLCTWFSSYFKDPSDLVNIKILQAAAEMSDEDLNKLRDKINKNNVKRINKMKPLIKGMYNDDLTELTVPLKNKGNSKKSKEIPAATIEIIRIPNEELEEPKPTNVLNTLEHASPSFDCYPEKPFLCESPTKQKGWCVKQPEYCDYDTNLIPTHPMRKLPKSLQDMREYEARRSRSRRSRSRTTTRRRTKTKTSTTKKT
jgi:hypothetical protein